MQLKNVTAAKTKIDFTGFFRVLYNDWKTHSDKSSTEGMFIGDISVRRSTEAGVFTGLY